MESPIWSMKHTYTGKPFPKGAYAQFKDCKMYCETHGTFITDNMRSKFSAELSREDIVDIDVLFNDFVLCLERNKYLTRGEKQYKITQKGEKIILDMENNGSSSASEVFYTLRNLKKLGEKDKAGLVKHFKLLGGLERNAQYFVGKADAFNSLMIKLSEKGLAEVIMPSEKRADKKWIGWFRGYANY